jgi:hypothetical protein
MHRAVIGNLAVCCKKAVVVALASGGHAGPKLAASRSHSASISSYVVIMVLSLTSQLLNHDTDCANDNRRDPDANEPEHNRSTDTLWE